MLVFLAVSLCTIIEWQSRLQSPTLAAKSVSCGRTSVNLPRKMPQHCCTAVPPGCTQNSKAEVNGRQDSFHSFPRDQELTKNGIVKIHRDEGASYSVNDSTIVRSVNCTND